MLRSKVIDDYIEATLSDFKAGVPLPCAVHLYFNQNRHIMVWRKANEKISAEFIEKYRTRGMSRVWIHRDDHARWLTYAQGESPQTILQPVKRKILDLLRDPALIDRHRMALVARAARDLLIATDTPQARSAVRDILDHVMEEAPPQVKRLVNELWNLTQIDSELEHAINVATYAVLFAMAFGRIDPELITDIALAGLVHDLGICQVSAVVVALPIKKHMLFHKQQYALHVGATLSLLKSYGPEIPERVIALVLQHHERIDGAGYPQALKGFQFNDVAQLLGMADTLDTIASGQWDGAARTVKESYDMIEEVEKSQTTSQHFNPEIYSAVLRWVKSDAAAEAREKAGEIVREKTHQLVKQDRAA